MVLPFFCRLSLLRQGVQPVGVSRSHMLALFLLPPYVFPSASWVRQNRCLFQMNGVGLCVFRRFALANRVDKHNFINCDLGHAELDQKLHSDEKQ
eukprot:NODE_993_length_1629_cov_5.031013_g819_i0.p3 GENE.NODE_993_length_1629_cov_5.031013_g819_i0~~NODE_993_length_1629_cov_5.031013_g819_i0.p3  ORF type:complete len:95 (+),score=2.32 NODE_993_length_1629_cov_5.031013_g819_i0:1167-1451(+)